MTAPVWGGIPCTKGMRKGETMKLHALDATSWLSTVWDALEDYHETHILEGDKASAEKWDDVCSAMAWIAEALEIDPINL